MEILINEFLHIYFWVYLIFTVMFYIVSIYEYKDNDLVRTKSYLPGLIGFTLFLVSIKY